jgi:hypothetical protein
VFTQEFSFSVNCSFLICAIRWKLQLHSVCSITCFLLIVFVEVFSSLESKFKPTCNMQADELIQFSIAGERGKLFLWLFWLNEPNISKSKLWNSVIINYAWKYLLDTWTCDLFLPWICIVVAFLHYILFESSIYILFIFFCPCS